MVSAKQILKELCETAIGMKRPCAVTKRMETISVRLDMQTFTGGFWTLREGNSKPFTTTSVFEAETKLDEMLKKAEVAA
jgi:hypothetical protein